VKKKILLAIVLVVLVLFGYVAGVTKKGAEALINVVTADFETTKRISIVH
jgi:hypothetical protein